jgi:hypothetical protein
MEPKIYLDKKNPPLDPIWATLVQFKPLRLIYLI